MKVAGNKTNIVAIRPGILNEKLHQRGISPIKRFSRAVGAHKLGTSSYFLIVIFCIPVMTSLLLLVLVVILSRSYFFVTIPFMAVLLILDKAGLAIHATRTSESYGSRNCWRFSLWKPVSNPAVFSLILMDLSFDHWSAWRLKYCIVIFGFNKRDSISLGLIILDPFYNGN